MNSTLIFYCILKTKTKLQFSATRGLIDLSQVQPEKLLLLQLNSAYRLQQQPKIKQVCVSQLIMLGFSKRSSSAGVFLFSWCFEL